MFSWVHSLYVFDHNHSHNLSASHQIKPCIVLQFMSALWRETQCYLLAKAKFDSLLALGEG